MKILRLSKSEDGSLSQSLERATSISAIDKVHTVNGIRHCPSCFRTISSPDMRLWDWDEIIWGKVRRLVFNLQKRIYKLTKAGKYRKARSLMYLLQHSYYASLLGVRKVTTENKGKNTPGVDKVKVTTPKQKMNLVVNVLDTIQKGWDKYEAKPAKRIYIPKANGKKRPLGIPTVTDRAMQAVTKSALEPFYEAKFESASYGFRPGMGCHDAIEKIAAVLLHKQKYILDADIKGFFDNIDHNFIVRQTDKYWKPIVKKWLKAGYMEESKYNPTKTGTPQGGIISPLLANIALDQMETDLIEHLRGIEGWKKKVGNTTVSIAKNKKTKKEYKARAKLLIHVVRYADDLVVIHEEKEVIEESEKFIKEWLGLRGLTLSEEKTKTVRSTDGFDFLGHHIRHYENRIKGTYRKKLLKGTPTEQRRAVATHVLRVEPTKAKINAHYQELSDIIGKMKATTPRELIGILQPKVSGFANYYKAVHSSKAFSRLDMLIWKRLYQWALRRHPLKGKKWVANKYFCIVNGRKWTFAEIKGKGKDREIVKSLKGYSKHKERTGSYAKVGYDRSYYDGDTAYWAERLSKGYGNITPSKAKLLKRQDGLCPVCKCAFTNEDLPEAHHIKPRQYGGLWEFKNMVLLHLHCHDKIHREYGEQKRKRCKDSREYDELIKKGVFVSPEVEAKYGPDITKMRKGPEVSKGSSKILRLGSNPGIISRDKDTVPQETHSNGSNEDNELIQIKSWKSGEIKMVPRGKMYRETKRVRDKITNKWKLVKMWFYK